MTVRIIAIIRRLEMLIRRVTKCVYMKVETLKEKVKVKVLKL